MSILSSLFTTIRKGITWSREVATGNDGLGSASRVVALITSTTSAGILIAHVAMTHSLPSAEQLNGLAMLTAAGSGAFAIGKIRKSTSEGNTEDGSMTK